MNLAELFKRDKKLFETKTPAQEVLDEDLGNLNAIDPKFRKLFSGWNSGGKRKAPVVSGNKVVGQNSPVSSVEVVTARQASDMFFGNEKEKSSAVGMILNADGKQVLALSKIGTKSYKSGDEYKVIIDTTFYTGIEKDKARLDKVAKVIFGYVTNFRSGMEDRTVNASSAKYILNSMFKAAKDFGPGMKIDALVIKADPERVAKQGQRVKARQGSEAIAAKDSRFEENARRALRSRLEAFKAKKATQYSSPEEFLAAAMKSGYMERVNIDGFVYQLDKDEIRVSNIVKPEKHWTNYDSIKYRLDAGHSEKLDALKKQMWDLRQQEKNNPDVDAKIDAFKEKFPPREISIKMSMQGGSIVPTSVEVSKEKDNWY